MKKLIFTIFVLFPLFVLAQTPPPVPVEQPTPVSPPASQDQEPRRFDYTTDDLNFDCKKCIEDEKGAECIYCDGMLTGASTVIGIYEYGKSFCPPNSMDTKMVRNAFRRWFLKNSDNPEMVNMRAVPGLIMAMKEMFPCKKK